MRKDSLEIENIQSEKIQAVMHLIPNLIFIS